MKKYIEIVSFCDESISKRIDVTEKSDRMIDKIDIGLNINLNHEIFYTRIVESKIKE